MAPDLESGFEPAVLLDRITTATEHLITTTDGLSDDDMRLPSLLPGWTRGHVLTHLARNAEGGTRLLNWARTGEPAQEYPSLTARAAQIEAGADRSTTELIADVRASADQFAAEYSLMPAEAWRHMVQWTAGQRHPAARIADARLCEVLVHHVDLQVGFTPDDWPADFVADELDVVTTALNRRENAPPMRLHATNTDVRYDISAGNDSPMIRGRQASLLAWLMGRSAGTDLTLDSGKVLPTPPFLYWHPSQDQPKLQCQSEQLQRAPFRPTLRAPAQSGGHSSLSRGTDSGTPSRAALVHPSAGRAGVDRLAPPAEVWTHHRAQPAALRRGRQGARSANPGGGRLAHIPRPCQWPWWTCRAINIAVQVTTVIVIEVARTVI
ncbi:maleylpyruvate isomerase family mycothiol-dependent enzyme [Actinomadura madurae]|uniref:maleylpyruvate isomerase family mycothiol-dependent enzyme n=1 Tax=Actinomadura madurae TaxID=1993 RepID=UPI0009F9BEBB|nr:maleylpyruvate isomerase family mycothiol-dependent enzyme [Actinomadura madurae]